MQGGASLARALLGKTWLFPTLCFHRRPSSPRHLCQHHSTDMAPNSITDLAPSQPRFDWTTHRNSKCPSNILINPPRHMALAWTLSSFTLLGLYSFHHAIQTNNYFGYAICILPVIVCEGRGDATTAPGSRTAPCSSIDSSPWDCTERTIPTSLLPGHHGYQRDLSTFSGRNGHVVSGGLPL